MDIIVLFIGYIHTAHTDCAVSTYPPTWAYEQHHSIITTPTRTSHICECNVCSKAFKSSTFLESFQQRELRVSIALWFVFCVLWFVAEGLWACGLVESFQQRELRVSIALWFVVCGWRLVGLWACGLVDSWVDDWPVVSTRVAELLATHIPWLFFYYLFWFYRRRPQMPCNVCLERVLVYWPSGGFIRAVTRATEAAHLESQ